MMADHDQWWDRFAGPLLASKPVSELPEPKWLAHVLVSELQNTLAYLASFHEVILAVEREEFEGWYGFDPNQPHELLSVHSVVMSLLLASEGRAEFVKPQITDVRQLALAWKAKMAEFEGKGIHHPQVWLDLIALATTWYDLILARRQFGSASTYHAVQWFWSAWSKFKWNDGTTKVMA